MENMKEMLVANLLIGGHASIFRGLDNGGMVVHSENYSSRIYTQREVEKAEKDADLIFEMITPSIIERLKKSNTQVSIDKMKK
jgi:hypothetical protein